MVALKGADAVIIDAKTGKPSPAHAVQVAIYQYAVPKALTSTGGWSAEATWPSLTATWVSPHRRWTSGSWKAWER